MTMSMIPTEAHARVRVTIQVQDPHHPERYRDLIPHLLMGRPTVGPLAGETFQVRVENLTGRAIAFKLSMGGIDTTTGNDAEQDKGTKYALAPHQTVAVKTWMQGPHGGSALVFASEAMSVSAARGKAGLPRDLISVAVWEEGARGPQNYSGDGITYRGSVPKGLGQAQVVRGEGTLSTCSMGERSLESQPKLGVGAGAFTQQEWSSTPGLREPRFCGYERIWFKPYHLLVAELAQSDGQDSGFVTSPAPSPGFADLGGVTQVGSEAAASDNEIQARWPRVKN